MKTFLSSTYLDLVDYRQAAAQSLERLGQQVGRMEVFGARPAEPSEACLAEIDECDLFVGMYAHRYGHIPDGSQVSITEAEFERARERNKPVFCFLIEEDYPWPPKMIEAEPGRSKLRDFKNRIGSGLVRETFTTSEDLAYKIAASVGRYLSTAGRSEAIRASAFFDKVLAEITNLRLELRGQKELLERVNHVHDLMHTSVPPKQQADRKLPLSLEGCWRESRSGSTLYARFVGEDLLVPYSFRRAPGVTGVFFDFQRRSEDLFFARYQWLDHPVQGFAFLERSKPDMFTGGWWYSEDVPRHALAELSRLRPNLPRMNDLELSRLPQPANLPATVEAFFSIPKNELMEKLHPFGP